MTDDRQKSPTRRFGFDATANTSGPAEAAPRPTQADLWSVSATPPPSDRTAAVAAADRAIVRVGGESPERRVRRLWVAAAVEWVRITARRAERFTTDCVIAHWKSKVYR